MAHMEDMNVDPPFEAPTAPDASLGGGDASEVPMTAAEYSEKVAQWLQQAYHMQMLSIGITKWSIINVIN